MSRSTVAAGRLVFRLPRPAPGLLERAWLFLAADRPDRLELGFSPAAGSAPGDAGPSPGDTVLVESGGDVLFRGEVERTTRAADAGGRGVSVVAYAMFQRRRATWAPLRLRRATDSEVAVAVADALGLVADVDPTGEVHELVEVDGDPLVFLRARAARSGRRLAVVGRRLAFGRGEREGPEIGVLRGPRGIVSSAWTDSRGAGGSGKIVLGGEPRWRPHARFRTAGVPGVPDGRYRAGRVLHLADSAGGRTVVEFGRVAGGDGELGGAS